MHTCKSHHVDAYLQKPSRQSSFRKLPLCLLADILILRRPSTRLPAGPWKWRWEIFPSANIRVKCVIVTNDWNINLTTLHLLNFPISFVGVTITMKPPKLVERSSVPVVSILAYNGNVLFLSSSRVSNAPSFRPVETLSSLSTHETMWRCDLNGSTFGRLDFSLSASIPFSSTIFSHVAKQPIMAFLRICKRGHDCLLDNVGIIPTFYRFFSGGHP